MGDLTDIIKHTSFPGRVRQFAAHHPGHAAALAVGAAWAEQPRGGCAIAVIPESQRQDPLVQAALALADRFALTNLVIRQAIEPSIPVEEFTPRERQPVHMPSLPRDLSPPWSESDTAAILTACAAQEKSLLLPSRDPRWGVSAAALLALAWISGDGRRVVWELPAGTPLSAWSMELELIGRLQCALKLLIAGADLPWPLLERGCQRWWIACSASNDTRKLMPWMLVGEEPIICAVASQQSVIAASDTSWIPGSLHELATGGPVTVLCTARHADVAVAAARATGAAVVQLTWLHPAPLSSLLRLAATGPLVVVGEDLARHLAPLAALDPGLHMTLAACETTAIIAEIRSAVAAVRGR